MVVHIDPGVLLDPRFVKEFDYSEEPDGGVLAGVVPVDGVLLFGEERELLEQVLLLEESVPVDRRRDEVLAREDLAQLLVLLVHVQRVDLREDFLDLAGVNFAHDLEVALLELVPSDEPVGVFVHRVEYFVDERDFFFPREVVHEEGPGLVHEEVTRVVLQNISQDLLGLVPRNTDFFRVLLNPWVLQGFLRIEAVLEILLEKAPDEVLGAF